MLRTFGRVSIAMLVIVFLGAGTVLGAQQDGTPETRAVIVDINSAPVEEIESVVMDELLARRIVENRPYANKRQLVFRNLMSLEDYEKIKERIIARRIAPDPQ